MSDWYRRTGECLVLELHVQPGAARTGTGGLHDGRLRVRLAARASDGRANAALVALIAARLGVAKRDVSIESGLTSRRKRVRVRGAGQAPDALLREMETRA
ncbi:MAG: DUF167 domain-containing protein [Burkholderiales bacterium]|nr:DUF167 domain-containing protein [Burkholderiales bacterium]